MIEPLRLRPAQREVLNYTAGRMAVSAVPGSGKTFTLSLLATRLIIDGRVDAAAGEQVLIVTYQNAGVDNFRARIHRHLEDQGYPDTGFDVRTLHSLALEIIRAAGETVTEQFSILDESQSRQFLSNAVDSWINDNPDYWASFMSTTRTPSPQEKTRWRSTTTSMAGAFIRVAKNERYRPYDILRELGHNSTTVGDDRPLSDDLPPLLPMLSAIYARYHAALERSGNHDFDDLIWQALDLLEQRPDLIDALRQRWPYVLEDESQDSVPLQERLLEALTGPSGNWVRVGDPNQAITSSFTAAHPRFFTAFIDREDVVARTLPNSGRSAPLIIGAANAVMNWAIDHHPVDEVRAHAFRRQEILPAPEGDAQPNPPNSEASLRIRVFAGRDEDELPTIAAEAWAYARSHRDHTIAILVPTHNIGYTVVANLDHIEAEYDSLLRGGGREREVASLIQALLALLANPLDNKALLEVHSGLLSLDGTDHPHPSVSLSVDDLEHLRLVMRSIHQQESLLFPDSDDPDAILAALPPGIADERELAHLSAYSAFLRQLFSLRSLPIDDLTLALADELFTGSGTPLDDDSGLGHEMDLAIAYQIAGQLRNWWEVRPEMRLPDLVAQLGQVSSGQRPLSTGRPEIIEPKPGRITLMTQHAAKGLEWDCVYLVGIDGFHIPTSLESQFQGMSDTLGVKAEAEATAQLRHLMQGQSGLFPNRSATESAHIEVIAERLRLLYVGITRARRALTISRSRRTIVKTSQESEAVTAVGAIYAYLRQQPTRDTDDHENEPA